MTAVERYAAVYDAAMQREWLSGVAGNGDPWADMAELFRLDPLRELDANLSVLAGYLRDTDHLVDIGGGAGRVSLALASRVGSVELVEPSAGMREQFLAARDEAGITNARASGDWWMDSAATGDVLTMSDVTYFVRDIAPFIRKLHDGAARRVMITIWQPTPGDMHDGLHRVLYGQAPTRLPGLPELAAALWEMEILPDIRPLPELPWWYPEATEGVSERNAVDFAMSALEGSDDDSRRLVEAHMEELFRREGPMLVPVWLETAREILVTWETGGTPLAPAW
jgi:hypothetical protein